jgi:regulation of enolase protein 1 (concanavalin A-like superfamily)
VPGGDSPHDLAAEIGVTNAPRVLQPVRGDFVMQAKIEGQFAPGDQSTLPGRTGYNGAGLVLMADANNVVCLARATLQREGGEPEHYANFEIRSGGELQRMGTTGDCQLPEKGPVFLRIERRSQKIFGAVSEDGAHWHELAPKELPSDWPDELQAGVVAISTSKEEFNPRFSKLQILK